MSWPRFVCLVFLLAAVRGSDQCPQLQLPSSLNLAEMTGTWYAVRGIEHSGTDANQNVKRTKSCPTISITQKGQGVEFQWNSKDKPQRKFELKINPNKPGLWEYQPSKKGSSSPLRSLQVTLLDGQKDIWGATMCKVGGRTASVILSRNPQFNMADVQMVSDILAKQGLNMDHTFDRCVK